MQSWALKECSFDYLVTMIDLFQKLYIRKDKRLLVEFEDFKSVLAQCFQWYQTSNDTIKKITESEQKTNLFEDGQQDKFETGFKEDRVFSANSKGSSFAANFNGFDTGSIKPDAAMLREFGLPVPMHMNEEFLKRGSMSKNDAGSS